MSRRFEDFHPLSPVQQGMLFHSLEHPGAGLYCEQVTSELRGDLDREAFRRAWRWAGRRHPALRSSFLWEKVKEPVQVVHPELPVEVRVHDWTDADEAEAERRLERFLAEDRAQGLELGRLPLMRFNLVRVAPERHVFIWTHHHILLDGWSFPLVLREVFTAYRALARGREPELPPARPYRDYIAWLRRRDPARDEKFWRRKLAGFGEATDLDLGSPRRPLPEVGNHQVLYGEDDTARLQEASRRYRTTLFTLVQGAWGLLLRSVNGGREDVVFGVTVSGRPPELKGVEGMVGLFINTIPNRVLMPADLAVEPWLRRLHAEQAELRDHDHTPLVRIAEWSDVPRGQKLFDTLLVYENYPAGPGSGEGDGDGVKAGVAVSGVRFRERTNYPVTLVAGIDGGRLVLRLAYDRQRFDATAMGRVMTHLRNLLNSLAERPEAALGALSPLTPAERHAVSVERWPVEPRRPVEETLHGRFEARAAAAPDAVALVERRAPGEGGGPRHRTYGWLDRRASELASRLVALGVGPEVPVGLCFEASAELIVALLAVLKAGGAYLPLDPSQPPQRRRFMLEDAAPPVVLSRGSLAARLGEEMPSGVRVVDLDRSPEEGEPEAAPVVPHPGPEGLAYVIYTSGSTGQPKGSMISHGNVLRLLRVTEEDFGFGADDVWTLFHSYAFDFSVWEIWGALAYGGRLVVVPFPISRSPEDFRRLLAEERVTVLNQTPSAFGGLVALEGGGAAPGGELAVRTVIFGGEALNPTHVAPWLAPAGDGGLKVDLVNMYGITETTVHVTHRLMTPDDASSSRSPIGRPIADLEIHLLDGGLRPVPLGVVGEMYVGGPGLARGYLGRAGLTAERFVPHPLQPAGAGDRRPGARLYRTGDLARLGGDGDLEFLGRADQQLKIRGFRIEPGEIEAVLVVHPAVAEAAVVARDEGGDQRLVAYLVAPGDSRPGGGELREHAAAALPEYMVPTAYVWIDALPLTANGKLDRAALPAPEGTRRSLGAGGYVPPRDEVEEVLAAIWEQALNVERVGVDDNFFALGGDSILSIRVLALARERGMGFSLPDLFANPTVAELARRVRSQREPDELKEGLEPFAMLSAADLRLLPPGVVDAYPLAMMQAGMLFHMELDPVSPAYHNVNSYRLRTPFDGAALGAALGRVVARHPVLRTGFELSGYSEPLQLVYAEAELPTSVIDLRGLPEEVQEATVEGYVDDEKEHPFDLTRPPQLRVAVHLRDDADFDLTLTENHAIFDGWSLQSTLAELFDTYRGLVAGEELPAVEPAQGSFRDFVFLERQALASEESRAFWRRRLADAPFLRLPRRPQVSSRGRRLGSHAQVLPSPLVEGLQALANRLAVPIKSVMLAVHLKVLSRVAESSDVVGGLVSHGRPEVRGGEAARGLFLNTLPVRLDLDSGGPGETWEDLVRRVFRSEQEILPHRRLPIAAIQQDLGGRQLFEVVFTYVHFHVVDEVAGSEALEIVDLRKREGTNFPLYVGFMMLLSRRQLMLELEYDGRELSSAQVASLAGRYRRVLEILAMEPGAPHGSRNLLGAGERQQLLYEWNDTAAPVPEAPVHRWFEAEARRRPGVVAVESERGALTYGELELRANRLAHRLRRLGSGSGTAVALVLDRCPELLVAIYGVLKAGVFFVPLDPGYPEDRLAFVLEDCGARLLLTVERLADAVPRGDVETLFLDDPDLADEEEGSPSVAYHPEQLVYSLYTSGSTGRPKGVQVSHRALANYFECTRHRWSVERDTRLLAVTSPSFDISMFELLLPPAVGGTVVLADDATVADGEALAAFLADSRIDVMQATPATWQMLVTAGWEGSSGLTALSGGEALPPTLAVEVAQRSGSLWNLYGPTETTIFSVVARLDDFRGDGEVSLGRPLANTRVHIVDRMMRPHHTGVPGELLIGGAGVARGYGGRPGLTAERFVPDPFAGVPGERLYRTGDLARWNPDGTLGFLGRLDHQVKIRGFRIELGEIEAVLGDHPAVERAVAVKDRSASGEDRILAYVTGDGGATEPELVEHVAERLPRYMVPSMVIRLDAIPLTPNGKVDRNALPRSEADGHSADRPHVPPEGEVETAVAALWEELLDVPRVGATDDFFALGGQSLVALRLVTRLRQVFGTHLSLADLLRGTTVRELAALLGSRRRGDEVEAPSSLVPFVPAEPAGSNGVGSPWFLVHPLGGNVVCYEGLARLLRDGRGVYGLQDPDVEEGGAEPSQRSLGELAAHHLREVRRVRPGGPHLLVGYSYGGVVAFEMACQLAEAGEEVELLALLDAQPPHNARAVLEMEEKLGIDATMLLLLDLHDRARQRGLELGLPLEQGWRMDPEERLEATWRAAQDQGLLPDEVGLSQARHYARFLQVRRRAYLDYRPRSFAGRVALLRTEAPEAGGEELGDLARIASPDDLAKIATLSRSTAERSDYGWSDLVRGELSVHTVPGDHKSIILQPHVQSIADFLLDFTTITGKENA